MRIQCTVLASSGGTSRPGRVRGTSWRNCPRPWSPTWAARQDGRERTTTSSPEGALIPGDRSPAAGWGCTGQGGKAPRILIRPRARVRVHLLTRTHMPPAPAYVHPQALRGGPLHSAWCTCPARNPGPGPTRSSLPQSPASRPGGAACRRPSVSAHNVHVSTWPGPPLRRAPPS